MLHQLLEQRLQQAVAACLPDANPAALRVRPCPDPKFGDYQANALMALAKERKMNPRQLAAEVLAKLDVSEWCDTVEIAGAGFLNFRLKPSALARTLEAAARGEHLFFQKAGKLRTLIVDYSSPNVAKPMHIGHIRSTGLGDALQRTFRLLGHRVITDNHLGDWGTQFGMLLVGWKRHQADHGKEPSDMETLLGIYRNIQAKTQIALESRAELVKLQAGDEENLRIWREMIRLSQDHFDTIYRRLGVKFDYTLGESFYNPWLGAVVADLLKRGIARESEQAVGVFSDGSLPPKEDPFLVNRDGEWLPDPALVRKSDGGFNYMTTDLATVDYRLKTWLPQEIVYVVDDRQSAHFRKLFLAFARWQPDAAKSVKFVHVGFGKILGDDQKPLKTRTDKVRISDLLDLNPETFLTKRHAEVNLKNLIPRHRHSEVIEWPALYAETFMAETGEAVALPTLRRKSDGATVQQPEGLTVKLADLLDEAEERAFKIVSDKSSEFPESQRRGIAAVVGIGAVKYADLLPNRQSDYVFSWDKMLALNGNTAPYLQYAYARIRSIFRKAGTPPAEAGTHPLALSIPEETTLAKHLLNFGLVLEAVAEEYRPNFLCNYLYDLAGHFARFYENCPVLKAEAGTRASRLALCDLTARVLKKGLEVLGIETLEQM